MILYLIITFLLAIGIVWEAKIDFWGKIFFVVLSSVTVPVYIGMLIYGFDKG